MKLARLSQHGQQYTEISPTDLQQGLLLIGQPRMGQRRLLASLLAQELSSGSGLGLLDVSGQYLPKLLGLVPSARTNDTAFLDFADREFPVGFNPLASVPGDERVRAKDALLTALRALFGDSWGPRLEHILAYSVMALLEYRPGTLLSLQDFLTDSSFRHRVLGGVTDPFVRYFFAAEFERWDERFRREAVAPIQNKVGQFLLDPVLRNLVCQVPNRVPQLSARAVITARAPRSEVGETASRLLGVTLLARWLQSDEEATVYVPDLHRLQSPGLASLIEGAAESRLRSVVSVSSLFTLGEELRRSLLAHIGHVVAFRLGPDDAEELGRRFDEFRPERAFQELVSLPPGQCVFRARRDGRPAQGYERGFVPAVPEGSHGARVRKIVRQSRERFAVPRGEIEAKLHRHVEGAIARVKR